MSRQSEDRRALNKALARLVGKWGRDVVREALKTVQTRKAGRPKEIRSLKYEMLAASVDEIADALAYQGCTHPVESALAEAAAYEGKPVRTLERYYRRGIELLKDRDARLLARFNEIEAAARRRAFAGCPPAVTRDFALRQLADEQSSTLGIVARIIGRAEKRLDNPATPAVRRHGNVRN